MNWNHIEGGWKQFKGLAKIRWGELTDCRVDVVAGKRAQVAGRIQEAYGCAQEADEARDAQAPESQDKPRDLQ